jgi:predicted acylesterase/phospholipase RssA
MKTALCISGGGLDGFCIGAGALLALEVGGYLQGDLECYGTSAGSALACWVAANRSIGGPGGLVQTLLDLRDSDIRDPRTLWRARLAWIDNTWEGRKLRALLDRIMPRAQDLRHPWHAYAVPTSMAAPMDVAFQAGADSPAAICAASMAIPCVFPPVTLHDNRSYQDGGTAMNLPLPLDPYRFDRVIVMVLSGARKTYQPPSSVLSGALTQFSRLMAGQTEAAIQRAECWRNTWIIRPPLDGRGGMLHLDHSLIQQAYAFTRKLPFFRDLRRAVPAD